MSAPPAAARARAARPAAPAGPGGRGLPAWARVVAPIVVGLVGIALWSLWVDVLRTAPKALPSPFAIAGEFVTRFGIIAADMGITATNAFLGLVVGSIVAVVLAGLAAASRVVDGMIAPLVAALAVVPIVAVTPILNTMFGASSQFGRQAVAGIAAFIPVFVTVLRGLRQTRPVQRDLLRAYAATPGQTFRVLAFPTALPYLLSGLRVAASLAVISALVAEYFGGPADGVGTAIATYAKSGRASLAWAYVFGAILIGLVFFVATSLLERAASRRPVG